MCLPHDPVAMVFWMETQALVLRAWRDELAFEDGDAGRLAEIEDHCRWLEREARRLRNALRLAPLSRQQSLH